jgi:hypothetical protein
MADRHEIRTLGVQDAIGAIYDRVAAYHMCPDAKREAAVDLLAELAKLGESEWFAPDEHRGDYFLGVRFALETEAGLR